MTGTDARPTIAGMRLQRVMQIVIGSLFGVSALGLLAVAVARAPVDGPKVFLPPLVAAAIGAMAVGLFQLQFRGLRKKGEAVRASVDACAARVFDAPGAVRPGYDLSVTMTPGMAAWVSGVDSDVGFTTEGQHRGARVSVASHVSVAGRQMGEFSHVYSYVCVDVLGATEPFYLTKQGAFSAVTNATGLSHDVKIGDAAFDAAWNVSADPALAKDVLDDSIRARLAELRARVPSVSMDMAQGTMSVILTKSGLAIRWPGPMPPELAIFMRDLLLDMRERILAHLDRRAARAGAGQVEGYRVVADEAAPASLEEPSDEAARRAAN